MATLPMTSVSETHSGVTQPYTQGLFFHSKPINLSIKSKEKNRFTDIYLDLYFQRQKYIYSYEPK